MGIAFDAAANLLFTGGRRRKIDGTPETVSTIAGTGRLGYSGGGPPVTAAEIFTGSARAANNGEVALYGRNILNIFYS